MITIKTKDEIAIMRQAGSINFSVLETVKQHAVAGVFAYELNDIAEHTCIALGGKPAFKGYTVGKTFPFPCALCVSINEEIVHGIPSKNRILQNGDVVKLDFGTLYDGYYADSAITVCVGEPTNEITRLMSTTHKALGLAIEKMVIGNKLSDIGNAIESHIKENGFNVVTSLTGHGIGKNLHEPPVIPNCKEGYQDIILAPGMVFAIEPMAAIGSKEVRVSWNSWTYLTKDSSIAAHYEHTVAITEDGPIVLTK